MRLACWSATMILLAGISPLRAEDPAPAAEVTATLDGAEYGFGTASFSADRSLVAAAGANGTMTVWKTADGSKVFTVTCPGGLGGPAAFSPDGRWVVTGHGDHSIAVRDAKTGDVLKELKGHGYAVQWVAFSPDGTRLASVAWSDERLCLWDPATGAALATHAIPGSWKQVVWFPDGKRLLLGGADSRIVDAESGKDLVKFPQESHGAVALSPDGSTVATGTWGIVTTEDEGCVAHNEGFLFRAADGQRIATLVSQGALSKSVPEWIEFAAQAGVCAILRGSGHISLAGTDGKETAGFEHAGGGIQAIAIAADGRSVLAACGDGKLRTWRVGK